jgi:DNA-binding protein Fis
VHTTQAQCLNVSLDENRKTPVLNRIPAPSSEYLKIIRFLAQLIAPVSKSFQDINTSTIRKLDEAHDELQRQVLVMAMQRAGWNQVHAAKLLGIKRTTWRQKLISLGVNAPSRRGRPQSAISKTPH